MSYRMLYVAAGLCFTQAVASAIMLVLALSTGMRVVTPGLFIVLGIGSGFLLGASARYQKGLYETRSATEAEILAQIEIGIEEGWLTEQDRSRILNIGRIGT